MHFKGFLSLASHRVAHVLWQRGRRRLAVAFQSRCSEVSAEKWKRRVHNGKDLPHHNKLNKLKNLSAQATSLESLLPRPILRFLDMVRNIASSQVFAMDLHPAATIGKGVMFDHGTGIVVGETAKIGDECSLLHGVTLGGTGKRGGRDRHPKLGNQVSGALAVIFYASTVYVLFVRNFWLMLSNCVDLMRSLFSAGAGGRARVDFGQHLHREPRQDWVRQRGARLHPVGRDRRGRPRQSGGAGLGSGAGARVRQRAHVGGRDQTHARALRSPRLVIVVVNFAASTAPRVVLAHAPRSCAQQWRCAVGQGTVARKWFAWRWGWRCEWQREHQ